MQTAAAIWSPYLIDHGHSPWSIYFLPWPERVKVLDGGTIFCSFSRDVKLYLVHYVPWQRQLHWLPLALPVTLHSIGSSSAYLSQSQSLNWKHNHRMSLGTHWTHELDFSPNSINHLTLPGGLQCFVESPSETDCSPSPQCTVTLVKATVSSGEGLEKC